MIIHKSPACTFSSVMLADALNDILGPGPDPRDYHRFTTMTLAPDVRPPLQGMSRNRMTILIGCYAKPDCTALLWLLWNRANPNERITP